MAKDLFHVISQIGYIEYVTLSQKLIVKHLIKKNTFLQNVLKDQYEYSSSLWSITTWILSTWVKLVSLAAVFWAVTQRSTQKKRLLTSELHSFLIVLAVCLRSFEQTNHVKMGLTDLRDSRCESVVLIKAFLILRLRFSLCIRDSSL